MSGIIVSVLPAEINCGPEIFSMHQKHDAETVIDRLSTEYGEGSLRDPQNIPVFSDPEDKLEAGHYTYTLKGAQGASWRSEETGAVAAQLQDRLASGSGSAKLQDLDAVSRLMDLFGDSLRDWHAEEAPGREHESRVLESNLLLQQQIALLDSRDDTYKCLLVNWARIFRRWRERRKNIEATDFAHGLAHMVILSCSGSGKTTVLMMLLRWMRKHFKDQGDEKVLCFLSWAMYARLPADLNASEAAIVGAFMDGAKRTIAEPHLIALLWAEDHYLRTTRCENLLGITAETGPALRLLYACLTPLSDNGPDEDGPGTYDDFLEGLPEDLRHGLECKHVLQLLRQALGVPPEEPLLLLTLVDEGNTASGAFKHIDHAPSKKGTTWLKQLLAELITMNASAPPDCNDLVVPVTVTTQQDAVDLRCVCSDAATPLAINIPVPMLTPEQTHAVVLDLARRAARAASQPELFRLPDDAAQAWTYVHMFVGGSPRLLGWVLEVVAGISHIPSSIGWSEGLHEKIAGLSVERAREILRIVNDRMMGEGYWYGLSVKGALRRMQLLQKMLNPILMGREATRHGVVDPDFPGVTWGLLEAEGLVKLNLPAPTVCDQAAARQPEWEHQAAAKSAESAGAYGESSTTSHGAQHRTEAATNGHLRPVAFPLLGGLAAALAAAEPDDSSDRPVAGKSVDSLNPVESRRSQRRRRAGKRPGDVQLGKRPADESLRSSHREGHEQAKRRKSSKAAEVTGQPTAAQERSAAEGNQSAASKGSTPVTGQVSSLPLGQHTIRSPVSMSQQSGAPSETHWQPVGQRGVEAVSVPQQIALLDHMCPQPSASPGDEPVLPAMGILAFTALLQDTGLMREDQLSLYSEELVCESALDADTSADVMSVCLKMEALAALGRKSFRLSEIFPGEQIGEHLAQTRFMVPIGRLSAGKGLHEAQKLDEAATGRLVDQIRHGIINSWERQLVHAELQVAVAGQGSNGHDGSVILVEEATPHRAWVLNVQSKHDVSAASPNNSCREILKWMHSDIERMHGPPQLHSSQQQPHNNSKEWLPEAVRSAEQRDDSMLEQRVSCAVTNRPFSKVQGEIHQQLSARGHPWMQRVLRLHNREQATWHTYVGPLLRYICHAAWKNPNVRAALGARAPWGR